MLFGKIQVPELSSYLNYSATWCLLMVGTTGDWRGCERVISLNWVSPADHPDCGFTAMLCMTPELCHVDDLVNTKSKTQIPCHVGLWESLFIYDTVPHLFRFKFSSLVFCELFLQNQWFPANYWNLALNGFRFKFKPQSHRVLEKALPAPWVSSPSLVCLGGLSSPLLCWLTQLDRSRSSNVKVCILPLRERKKSTFHFNLKTQAKKKMIP